MVKLQGQAVNERSPYWDNIKGFLICLVVFGHFLWDYRGIGLAGFLVNFIYLFHMPAFIFVSGYLSKSDHAKSMGAIIKLTVIYIIFNTSMMIFSFVLVNTSFQFLTPVYSFWFLISLIIWRFIIKYVEKIKYILLISIITAIFIGLWSDVTNVLAIARTIVFFPFFLVGYKLSADNINHFINNRKPIDYMKGILLLLLTAYISSLFIYQYKGLSETDFLMQSYDSITDMFVRIIMLSIAGLMIRSIMILTPKKPLKFLSKWGKNSLTVYILHRFITLMFFKVFPSNTFNQNYMILAFCASVLTLLFLGSDMMTLKFNWVINKATDAFFIRNSSQNEYKRNMYSKIAVVLLIICFSLPIIAPMIFSTEATPVNKTNSTNANHKVMTSEQKSVLKDAVSIAFVGDLILLQDQVRNAYSDSSNEYEFGSMFEYASKYLIEADLAIGIFEGPTAGEEVGYSTSNYDDGLPLYLNYPDSFARAVKDSGIDLVSTANNHLLDKGEEGALRTLDILDEVGLLHIGSYRNEAEKNSVMIIEKEGLRIAFLAYTFGSNGYTEEYFLNENPSLTSILADPSSRYFKEVKAKVLSDFQRIKDMENPPDMIAVLPHMGTQFLHATDTYQDTWNDIFIQAGADIILGDHAHAVQPIEFRTATYGEGREKLAIIVNCPGNFANSYVEKDGDATSIVEVYIDPKTKEIISAGVIPMYTQAPANGNYRALPIYSILNEPVLQKEISTYEMGRIAEVQAMVSSIMLRAEITLDQVQERYYLFPEGYVRQPIEAIKITDEMRATGLYKLLNVSETICFVGDSITAGSENGGYGWHEPLMAAFSEKKVYKEAWASATTLTLLNNAEAITEHSADLYVIAIGTNDVRYRNKKTCAMDKDSYVENINKLLVKIQSKNPNANFVFISPWLALDNDPYTAISIEKRDLMLAEYGEALELYCEEKGYSFIKPNAAIDKVLRRYAPSDFLIDHIHPNASAGIKLYSEKVLAYNE
jgi:fucose 4-O-acetylase-like acetyltransferase/lysophospholipase L1-like esterase